MQHSQMNAYLSFSTLCCGGTVVVCCCESAAQPGAPVCEFCLGTVGIALIETADLVSATTAVALA
jgi:hypothetical protein